MKKHQKVLLGIMTLSLAGGTGTAVALKFNASGDKTTSVPTDDAIYLYWGDKNQSDATTAEVKDFEANVPQYRPLVVAPQSSKDVYGKVELKFSLSLGKKGQTAENHVLTGLTVTVYEADSTNFDSENSYSYKTDDKVDEGTVVVTLAAPTANETTGTTQFFITESSEKQTTTKWYLIKFLWDGTRPGQNETFGGNLDISQTFTANATEQVS